MAKRERAGGPMPHTKHLDQLTSETQHITKSPKGIWVYRRRVPQDLRDILGRHEIKLSLKTDDFLVAMLIARVLNEDVEKSFEDARKLQIKMRNGEKAEEELTHGPIEEIMGEAVRLTEDALERLGAVKEELPI